MSCFLLTEKSSDALIFQSELSADLHRYKTADSWMKKAPSKLAHGLGSINAFYLRPISSTIYAGTYNPAEKVISPMQSPQKPIAASEDREKKVLHQKVAELNQSVRSLQAKISVLEVD